MRLAAALAAGALVTVSIGLLERHLLAAPYPIAYVHLFFTDTFYMKAWLASATLALGVGQLITAAGMYRVLRIAPPPRLTQLAHRWSGRVAMALTLPVAFNCLFELGVHPLDPRILVHALLGAFIYGVFVTKWLVLRVDRAPGWLVPLLGSALFYHDSGVVAHLRLLVVQPLWLASVAAPVRSCGRGLYAPPLHAGDRDGQRLSQPAGCASGAACLVRTPLPPR